MDYEIDIMELCNTAYEQADAFCLDVQRFLFTTRPSTAKFDLMEMLKKLRKAQRDIRVYMEYNASNEILELSIRIMLKNMIQVNCQVQYIKEIETINNDLN